MAEPPGVPHRVRIVHGRPHTDEQADDHTEQRRDPALKWFALGWGVFLVGLGALLWLGHG